MNKQIIIIGKQILKFLIKCFIKLADTNKDGKIQLKELEALFKKSKKAVKKVKKKIAKKAKSRRK